jgi:uncharacterized protein YecE (DUF72 family)
VPPVRIGVCSFADKGLVERWYPRGVSTPAARLAYYADRFDVCEVDSPYYRLPAPETAARWAERTPPGFLFHAKASGEMTGHRERPGTLEDAFREFRQALAPLESAGKLRGVLLQYPPWFRKAPSSLEELTRVRLLLEPLVPLVEFRHRSWMTGAERGSTLAFLEDQRLAYVSVDAPRTGAANVLPPVAAATREVAYVRFHGRNSRTWNIRGAESAAERFDWLYSEDELAEWTEPVARLARDHEVYAMFNNNRDDFAPRSAVTFRRLLDEAGVAATGGIEPEPTLF